MTWLLLAVGVAVLNLLLAELFDWFDWLAQRVVTRSVRHLPPRDQERWQAEWLAELEVLPGKHISHLLWALSIRLNAPRLARTLGGRPSIWVVARRRALEVTFATVALFILAPLLLVIVAALRLESPGPALYRERRIGRAGKPIYLLRFRTLPPAGHRHRSAVGALLRRGSLDELPMLVNVLRGEVSLVQRGPR